MKRPRCIRSLIWGICLVSAVFIAVPSQSKPVSQVEIRLIVLQKKFVLGERIPMKVEIVNRGEPLFFVGRRLQPYLDAPSSLTIVVKDSEGNESPDLAVTLGMGDRVRRNWWVELPLGHFYGAEIWINLHSHKALARPGKYRLLARYLSRGGEVLVAANEATPVWRGELESNAVEVEVTAIEGSSPRANPKHAEK